MNNENNMNIQLLISPELLEIMDRALITEDDALRTVAHCEETGIKLLDTSTGDCVGHLRDEALTYWVRYRPEGNANGTNASHNICSLNGTRSENNTHPEDDTCSVIRLLGIYTHRAGIDEGKGQGDTASAYDITCLKCNRPLTGQKTHFTYLGFPFSTPLPRCPACGQVYVSQEFAAGKLCEVEETLEDK